MADDEDDYLSDKFLVESASASSNPKTYAERRKEAQREAQIRNEANRRKSRRQREHESREEGLSKSLFERAKEEEASGINTGGIKALSMMMKMGFKPGQALGRSSESSSSPVVPAVVQDLSDKSTDSTPVPVPADQPKTVPKHKTEPIPLNEWTGTSLLSLLTFLYQQLERDSIIHRKTGHWRIQTSSAPFTHLRRKGSKDGQDG